MNLRKIENDRLISELKVLVRNEKDLTLQILRYLKEVESRKLELARGHSSLYKFCLIELGYSEAEALVRIRAMRLLKCLPQLENQIENGNLSLSNAAELQNQLRREEERRKSLSLKPIEALESCSLANKMTRLSTRECQRSLALEFPEIQSEIRERTKVLKDKKTMIQFSASKELMEKLEKLRGLLAHKNFSGNYASLIEELAEIALKKLDPAKQKPRDTIQGGNTENATKISDAPLPFAPSVAKLRSRYIPTQLRRKIWIKAGGKCQFQDSQTGNNCDSQHGLEIDHIKRFSEGGSIAEANLRLLCDAHNRWRTDAGR